MRLTTEALKTLQGGYLLPGESPSDMIKRLVDGAVEYYYHKQLPTRWLAMFSKDLFRAFHSNWLGAATPVAANFNSGTSALPISCFVVHTEDSISSIFGHLPEVATMAQKGGGVGVGFTARGKGSPVGGTQGNGKASGPVSFMGVYDRTAGEVSQGGTRRGAFSMFMDVDHPDVEEFLRSKNHAVGDPRRHLYQNIGLHISDEFMEKVKSKDEKALSLWFNILQTRIETGVPYLHFINNHNAARAEDLVNNDLAITGTNICTEISSAATDHLSMVCCLSSLNLEEWEAWRSWRGASGLTLPQLGIYFLEAVMEEFITKSKDIPELSRARDYAIKGRPLGLGVLGFHGLLMKNLIPFGSDESCALNHTIFAFIQQETLTATRQLGNGLGSPVWCRQSGRRHIQTTAIAPTVSNSVILGAVTAGITPQATNYFVSEGAKGIFKRKNRYLEELWKNYYNLSEVEISSAWEDVLDDNGSVQNLHWMSPQHRRVFLTGREISQLDIISLAAERQQYLEQTQSVNLFMGEDTNPQVIHDAHFQAWEKGLPTLYYIYSDAATKGKVRSLKKKGKIAKYTIVEKDGCPYCNLAKGYMLQHGMDFITLDKSNAGKFLREGHTFPMIWSPEGEFIGGFAELVLKDKNNNQDPSPLGECASCDG